MGTNPSTEVAVDDSKEVTEEDLRSLKYGEDGVETSKEADEPDKAEETSEVAKEADKGEEDGQTDDQPEEAKPTEEKSEEAPATEFVKEFPHIKGDTPEEYAKNLELAYKNSTSEAMRLKKLVDEEGTRETPIGKTDEEMEVELSNPVSLYMKQKMDEEITTAFNDFSKNFPQVQDTMEYDKFTREVATLSQTILASQKRLAPPRELYSKAAVILGWEPANKVTDQEKLNMALKDSASVSKTPQAGAKVPSKSKVTDAMVAINRRWYPGKTDAQIREELEPYVK